MAAFDSKFAKDRERLIEQFKGLVFLAEIGVDPAHIGLRVGFGAAVVVLLFNREGFVEPLQPLIGIARAAVELAENIQLRAHNRGSIGRPCIGQQLLMLDDHLLKLARQLNGVRLCMHRSKPGQPARCQDNRPQNGGPNGKGPQEGSPNEPPHVRVKNPGHSTPPGTDWELGQPRFGEITTTPV